MNGSRAKRLVEQYVAPDGSMEYILHLFLDKRYGSVDGRKIQVTFPSFDYQSDEKAGMPTPAVEGNWTLSWTLRSTSEATIIAPNTEIGDSGMVLLEAEIGQKTVCTTISFRNTTTVTRISPSDFMGVRMKDGTEHLSHPATAGCLDEEKLIYFIQCSYFDAILDISQVESLMFHKGWKYDASGDPTSQLFTYIPIS